MNITGQMLIGSESKQGTSTAFNAVNPATGEMLQPTFLGGSKVDVEQACQLAAHAFDCYRQIDLEQRAVFLETIGQEILALGDSLVQRAVSETGLPQARIEGERGRTINQLNLFASVVRAGHWLDLRVDEALPERTPPRADLRLRHIPLGPVVVFGASNFPLAFSVAGGDTASAFASGCPVIVKAHSAHPGTSELVGRAIQAAVKKCNMPAGIFSLIFGNGREVGVELVANPAIKAVGFTGSRAAGIALMNIAANRAEPIPVYAEMSSINPVFLLPSALKKDAESLAQGFVGSLVMGAGQFCTNPGLVFGVASTELDAFVATASKALAQTSAQTMLTAGIHTAYLQGWSDISEISGVTEVASGLSSDEPNRCQAKLFKTSAAEFLANNSLKEEVFGALSLVVECQTLAEMTAVAESLEGQLTATMQLADEDLAYAQKLLPVLERKAGRILCNGYPTGVEVCHSMVHGGPFPATSDSRSTSVGSAAILRFLRPVSYQDLPDALLPKELKKVNELVFFRLNNGQLSKA